MEQDKKGNQQKFGWLCSYTPVELLTAGGMVPMRLDAGNLLLQKPNPHIYQLICPYIRAVFDVAQKDLFGPLDGVLFMKCCDGMLRLYDLWKTHLPSQKSYVLPLPKVQTPEAEEYFAEAMRRFAREMSRDQGVPITEDALHQAIGEANRFRSAVQKLYHLRFMNPLSLSYFALQLRIREWLSTDPAQALPLVERELKALKGKPDQGKPGARVLISSSTLDQLEIIKIIEEAGITIVADDLCSGARHFDHMVSENGDPYLSLAKRYLNRWPCPRMQAGPSHIQRLLQEVQGADANGIIHVGLKYCDQSGYDLPRLQTWFRDRRIPFLSLENDYTVSGLGQLKVRIEAFAEILKGEF